MSTENPTITVEGVRFDWDPKNALMLCMGVPVVTMWVETTMAGLMAGLQKMIGTELFILATQAAGAQTGEGEWEHIISKFPTPEEGVRYVGVGAMTVGLGQWELLSIDYEKKEARFRSRTNWEAMYQKALGVCWGSGTLAGKLAAHCSKVFGTSCWSEQLSFLARGDAYDEFIVRQSTKTIEQRLGELLQMEGNEANWNLEAALKRLKQEVAERQLIAEKLEREIADRKLTEERLRQEVDERAQVEQELRSKLDIIKNQEAAIRAMSTPILQLWDGVLTMPVIGRVDSTRAALMMENLLQEITKTQARITILDLTGVDHMDTSAANHLLSLVHAAGLLGTRCLVSGISPNMANAIVDLGLDLGDLAAFGTLEAALRYAIQPSAHLPAARPGARPGLGREG